MAGYLLSGGGGRVTMAETLGDFMADTLHEAIRERDDARAIARQLAAMVRLFVLVAPSTEYQAEHALRAFDALPWAQDET